MMLLVLSRDGSCLLRARVHCALCGYGSVGLRAHRAWREAACQGARRKQWQENGWHGRIY